MTKNKTFEAEVFGKLEAMEDKDLYAAAKEMGLVHEGKERDEVIAELLEARYDPDIPMLQLLPVFLGISTSDNDVGRKVVQAVSEQIRSERYTPKNLIIQEQGGRVCWSSARFRTVPCRLNTAKRLLEAGALKAPERDAALFQHILNDPESWMWTFLSRRATQSWLITLHVMPRKFDRKLLERYQPQAV